VLLLQTQTGHGWVQLAESSVGCCVESFPHPWTSVCCSDRICTLCMCCPIPICSTLVLRVEWYLRLCCAPPGSCAAKTDFQRLKHVAGTLPPVYHSKHPYPHPSHLWWLRMEALVLLHLRDPLIGQLFCPAPLTLGSA
jgi:hypothetical protein